MTEEAKKRKNEYIKNYQKTTYTNISFKIRTKDDQDILDRLAQVDNKSEYIKALIRADAKF